MFLTFEPNRSRTTVASPHCCGGETPGGGGGMYFATRLKLPPMSNSGGQVENAIVPPGFRTRSISAIATLWSRSKHVTVLTHDDIKLPLGKRQSFDVSDLPIDFYSGEF